MIRKEDFIEKLKIHCGEDVLKQSIFRKIKVFDRIVLETSALPNNIEGYKALRIIVDSNYIQDLQLKEFKQVADLVDHLHFDDNSQPLIQMETLSIVLNQSMYN